MRKFTPLIFISFLFSFHTIFAGDIQESDFARVDKDYYRGEYKLALQKAKSLVNKTNENYDNYLIAARANFKLAKIYDALGRFNEYKEQTELGSSRLSRAKLSDTLLFIRTYLDAAQTYSEYGEFSKALSLIEIADKLLKNGSDIQGDLLEEKVKIAMNMGYLVKAEKLSQDLVNSRKERLSKVYRTYNYDQHKYQEIHPSTKEINTRKNEYARAINLQSEIKIKNTDYASADSLVDNNLKWISANVGKKQIAYSRALFLKGLILENKNESAKASGRFAKALKAAGKSKDVRFKVHSKPAIDYYEKLIPALRKSGNSRKSGKRETQLEARIKRYYGKDNYYYGRSLLIDVERYFKYEDYKKAESKITSLLKGSTIFPEDHLQRSRALEFLYKAQIENEDYLHAEETLRKISAIKQAAYSEKAPAYHMSKIDEANYIVHLGAELNKAEKIYAISLNEILEKEVPHNNKQYINGLYNQAKLFEYKDDYQKSLITLDKAKSAVGKYSGITSVPYGIALDRYASLEILLGKYHEAESDISKSLELFKLDKRSEENIDFANALETLGRYQMIQGRFDEAEKSFKKSLRIIRAADENEKISTVAEELVNLNILTGRYGTTESALSSIIQEREEKFGNKHRSLITPLNQLGNLYLITGDFVRAEKLVRRAHAISSEIFGPNSVLHSESIKLLQKIFVAIGDYGKAEEAGSKVLNIQTQQLGKNHISVAISLNDLALVKFYDNHQNQDAENLFLQSLTIINSTLGNENLQYAEVLKNLSLFYIENKKTQLAEEHLEKANKIWINKLGQNNIHSAEAAFIKGGFFYKTKNYEKAKEQYALSKNIYSKLFDTNHPDYVKALSREGQMSYILNDYKNAVKCLDETTTADLNFIKKYFPSLSEREKNKFWNLIKSDFEFYNTLAIKLSDENPELLQKVYNFSLKTKAILLNSSIKVKERILNSNNQELIGKYQLWVEKKEYLTSSLSMSAEQQKANSIDVRLLEKEIEGLEKELSEKSEAFMVNYEKADVDWKSVRETLKANEYAVEIIRFRLFEKDFSDSVIYAGLISHKDSKSPDLVLLSNGNELENKYLHYYRNCVKLNVEDEFSFNKFWSPFNKIIKENSTIYISGDGVYNQVNLETIPTPEKDFLLNRFNLVLVSNTKDLVITNAKHQRKNKAKSLQANKIKLFGNPTYYDSGPEGVITSKDSPGLILTSLAGNNQKKIPQLPGAESEIRHLNELLIKNGWETEAFLNSDATESKLKSIKDPRVFHIATHGFFMEDIEKEEDGTTYGKSLQNPLLRSGLLLKNGGTLLAKDNIYEINSEDGILTAYEAMNLYLDNTDLVVLSACETGAGKIQLGEGVYGLQRAFLIAGANSVIMSLFKVSDDVTKELMTIFYDNWIATGDKRKSFLEAKRQIKIKYKDPIYWGAFIMIGTE